MRKLNKNILFAAAFLLPAITLAEKVVVIPLMGEAAAGSDGQVQYNDNNKLAGAEIYYNGYLGIGETNPNAGLDIKSSAGYGSSIELENTGGGLRWGITSWTDASLRFVKKSGTTFSAMVLKDTGRIGIGVSDPALKVHIKQDVSNKGLRIQHNSTTDYWENGVGLTTKNYKFYYNNIFRADISSTDGSYTQSSDGRLKHDLSYMDPVLPKVMELKPAQYKYIGSSPDTTHTTGFVAQEVESVFPELVRDMDDGYKGVIYDGFAVISIKAIQELNQQIAVLQAEIQELKKATR